MSKKHAVLFLAGPDEPGIAAVVLSILSKWFANALYDSIHIWGGWAMMETIFETDAQWLDRISSELREQLAGLNPHLVRLDDTAAINAVIANTRRPVVYDLHLLAPDAPGIGAEIHQRLALLGVNVAEARCRTCGNGANTMLHASFRVEITTGVMLRQMRDLIHELETQHHWFIDFDPAKITQAPPMPTTLTENTSVPAPQDVDEEVGEGVDEAILNEYLRSKTYNQIDESQTPHTAPQSRFIRYHD